MIAANMMNGLRNVMLLAVAGCLGVSAQIVRNPKLAPADLESAKDVSRTRGGNGADLVYAARIDAVTKGKFDSLVVVYSTGSEAGKEYYAVVVRDGQKLPLAAEASGLALPKGDRFLRIGLKHDAEKTPLLRLMGAVGGSADGERNVDFRFDGKEFTLIEQTVMKTSR